MNSICYKKIFKYIAILFLSGNLFIFGQNYCDWALPNDPAQYEITQEDELLLFYCENSLNEQINAPEEYTDVIWSYSTSNGLSCQDWDYLDGTFIFSINYNDPCYNGVNEIEVNFSGINEDNELQECSFTIVLNELGDPYIDIENYNTDNQIITCEENDIILTASGLGSLPNYSSFEWYLNGEIIPNENSIELIISNTDYDINSPNTFYFQVRNYCSEILDTQISSDWLTISIYEGYDNCEACKWDFPIEENDEFFGFCIDCDGDGYFPEKPNNETNRSFENLNRTPSCEATIYKIQIFNRIGRKIFESNDYNHPWDGKLKNGKKCKEGTYFYKIEYTLNPHLPEEYTSQNKSQVKTGSVYLAWGN
tara:strand:+ start:3986 stop:5083 length:1098 start_codon:yes stop_codon:yes gene_type:complete